MKNLINPKPSVKRKARTVIKIWRAIAAIIIFLILSPTFLANHEGDHFFTIVLILTALVAGLLMIIKQPLKKKLRKYIDSGMKLLLIGALLVILAATQEPGYLRIVLLVLSSLFYSFGIQRLGVGYVVGLP